MQFLEKKCSLEKSGLGFNPFKRKIFSKNKFGSSNEKTQISYFYCHNLEHIASRWYYMQKSNTPKMHGSQEDH